jgi:hypothetical protein
MSGYSHHLLDRDGVLEAGLHFLAKPITPDGLVKAVRAALDAQEEAKRGAQPPSGASMTQ